ncbi:serine hydrolase [Bacillus cereus]|uniref:serine hydrolase n=1 Tax=Bacillus nitratireducens TaxID=2026193 RepID=UPI0002FEF792|nr:serine hydrolase [Bacillus nitratireducens]PEB79295.1 serine hydrolase [Bacillus cereus]PEW89528.1 serine hydrolase [Bacillus cereus]PFH81217.1 serine hydrolase [Bacillus cereus]PFN80075.1 serine hydrolase [Bacillus cereus]SEA70938.1 Beta-lactamase enzyme family protein [Bacillus nitratireducens]
MQAVIGKIKEIQTGQVGILVYSTKNGNIVATHNNELYVPLASAAKVAIGFAVAKMVKDKLISWNDTLHHIKFNPNEDSAQLYPHLQGRATLTLSKAVEVMIACHDSYIAQSIVMHCGGWDTVREYVSTNFSKIHIQENPRDEQNVGELNQVHSLLVHIFQGYKSAPELWEPIISGMVMQQGEYEGIPYYHLAHMTGGLSTATINIGIIGMFHEFPFLYVIGGKDLPNRFDNKEVDETILEAFKCLYKEYKMTSETNVVTDN